jgi:hypothetical protein
VAGPNKVSIVLAANPGGKVDHFPATDVVIRIYSNGNESSSALANANDLPPLSTLPLERSKSGA